MCKQETESFIFHTEVYKTTPGKKNSFEINDQNVIEFEFINLSNSQISINKSITLETRNLANSFYRWKETINENEKTQTIYKIIMDIPINTGRKDLGLIVIMKMKAKPRG